MAKISIDQALLKAKSHAKKGEIEEAKKAVPVCVAGFSAKYTCAAGFGCIEQAQAKRCAQALPQEIIDQLLALYNQGQLSDVVDQAQALTEQYPEAFFVWNVLGAATKAWVGRKMPPALLKE